jgi:hypothetical protein
MANKSLLFKNIKDLSKTVGDAIAYVDLDYEIKRPADDPWTTHTRSMVCKDDYAILNAYRLWLQSRRYDYIRSPSFGGFFENNLNDRFAFRPENEAGVSQALVQESNEKWPDINVLECNVTCDTKLRGWVVHILAQDKGTKMVLSDNNVVIPAEDND